MKNRTIKGFTSILGLGALGSAAIGSGLSSCSKNPTLDFIGNDTGTNWEGWRGGKVTLGGYDKTHHTCILQTNDNYQAQNFIIPKYISYENQTYAIVAIANHAFEECSGLTGRLDIPNSVKLIGEFCFWGCHGLTGTLMIPNSVEYIGRNAFAYCTGFTGDLIINILDETSIIGLYPFAGNSESHMAMHIKRIIVPYLAQKPNTWEDNWNLKDGYNDEKYNVEWSNS